MARAKRGKYRGLNLQDVMTAQSEGKVRYGAQRSSLQALLGEAKGAKKADIRAAKVGAKMTIRGAKQAKPQLKRIYNTATGAADSAAADVETAFGSLGAAADPFRAATAREQGAAQTRLATAKASGLKDLLARQTEARAGRQFAVQQAKSNFRSDMSKLSAQLQALGDQEGAYVAGRIGALGQSRADRRTKVKVERLGNRNARRLERDRQAGRETLESQKQAGRESLQAQKEAAAKSGPGGSTPATKAERRAFTTNFEKALRYAKEMKNTDRYSREKAADALIMGQPAYKVGNESYPATPSIEDQTAISAALDMVYNGSLSPKVTRRIRNMGIRPRGLPSATVLSKTQRSNQNKSSRYGWGY